MYIREPSLYDYHTYPFLPFHQYNLNSTREWAQQYVADAMIRPYYDGLDHQ